MFVFYLPILKFRFNLSVGTVGTFYQNQLNYDQVVRTLVGNLVALLFLTEDVLERYSKTNDSTPLKKFISTLKILPNEVMGYAICRHCDQGKISLEFLTPIEEEPLKKFNAMIAAGRVGLPVAIFGDGKKNMQNVKNAMGLLLSEKSQRRIYVPGVKAHSTPRRNFF